MKKNFFKKYSFLMANTLKGKSLCRILQLWEIKNKKLVGSIIEFGTTNKSNDNFNNYLIKNKNLVYFADKEKINKETILIDLEKKNVINKKFNNVIIFNVLEHVNNINNASSEIKNLIKKDGTIIGSTPFLYRVHAAPKDYARYTSTLLEEMLKSKKLKKIIVKNLGFGPATTCYSLFWDFIKYVPSLPNLILTLALFIDFLLGLFVKTKLKNIYPIAIFFSAKK